MATKFDTENIDTQKVVNYIHTEIAANGTSSMFYGKGLDPDTGEYDADAICDAILAGEIEFDLTNFEF